MKRLIKTILKYYTPHCIVVVLCIIVTAYANVQGTMFMQTLIDDYITPLTGTVSPDFGPLGRALLQVACIYLLGVLANYGFNRIMVNVSQGTMRNLRKALFTRMESLPIKYFDTHSHGDVMSIYTNDTDTLRQMIGQSIPQLMNSVISIVSVFISMIVLDIPMTLLSLAMVAVMLIVTKQIAGLSGKYFVTQQKNIGIVNGYIEEMMEGQKVVKVFCHEEENLDRFRQLNEELRDSANNANKWEMSAMLSAPWWERFWPSTVMRA